MDRVRRLLLFTAGLALVLGARLGTREPPAPPTEDPAPPTAPAPPVPVAATARPADEAAADPACAALQAAVLERLDAVQAAADEIEELELLLSGEPLPWPEDVPTELREEAVREVFEAAAEAAGRRLVLKDLRCDEYPCIGIFERLDDDERPGGMTGLYQHALESALDEVAGDAAKSPLGYWRSAVWQGNHVVAFALHAPDLGDDERNRITHRLADYQIETTGMRWIRSSSP